MPVDATSWLGSWRMSRDERKASRPVAQPKDENKRIGQSTSAKKNVVTYSKRVYKRYDS